MSDSSFNKYFILAKKNRLLSPEVILSLIYLLVLLRFYIINYYVPDFRGYASWPISNLETYNGYSSLFIQICGFISLAPRFMTVLCLVMLSCSLFFIARGSYYFLYNQGHIKYYLSLIAIYSAGIWYYFYGKTFYDFPFAAISFGILFLIVSKIYVKISQGRLSEN